MSGTTGTIPLNSAVADQLITSALWNAELANIGALLDAAGAGGHSGTDAEAQIQSNPFPGSVLSKATSVAGELERIRYQLAQILGTDYWYKPATSDIATLNKGSFIGAIVDAPSATPPNANWHLADGTAISRAAYPDLFAYIGTTFGVGDGSSTFNLPDYRDRMSIGAGTSYAVAAKGGATTHVLTNAELPAAPVTVVITDPGHGHTQNAHNHSVSDPGHVHSIPGNVDSSNSGLATTKALSNGAPFNSSSATTGVSVGNATATNNSNTTGITAAGTIGGSGSAHSVLNPYLAMYKMMRVL